MAIFQPAADSFFLVLVSIFRRGRQTEEGRPPVCRGNAREQRLQEGGRQRESQGQGVDHVVANQGVFDSQAGPQGIGTERAFHNGGDPARCPKGNRSVCRWSTFRLDLSLFPESPHFPFAVRGEMRKVARQCPAVTVYCVMAGDTSHPHSILLASETFCPGRLCMSGRPQFPYNASRNLADRLTIDPCKYLSLHSLSSGYLVRSAHLGRATDATARIARPLPDHDPLHPSTRNRTNPHCLVATSVFPKV